MQANRTQNRHSAEKRERPCHRADELGPLARDEAADQFTGLESEQRERLPQLAVEVQHPVHSVVPDRGKAVVEMRLLPA